jgi:hypothetical protein
MVLPDRFKDTVYEYNVIRTKFAETPGVRFTYINCYLGIPFIQVMLSAFFVKSPKPNILPGFACF